MELTGLWLHPVTEVTDVTEDGPEEDDFIYAPSRLAMVGAGPEFQQGSLNVTSL